MRAAGWNMRGFSWSGQRTQLHDFISKEQLDIIFLQETMHQDFTDRELRSLVNGELFHWHWRAAVGRSGGMLLGIRDDAFEVGSIDQGQFFLGASIMHRHSRFKFDFIGFCGPADHTCSSQFLGDLETKVLSSSFLVVVLGDFNLIRGPRDKSNSNVNWPLVNAFNDSIARMALREVARTGARFTWSNQQRSLVRCVLDGVLVSPEWEIQYPLLTLRASTSLGSDHTPLVLDTWSVAPSRSSRFYFETSWFDIPVFREMVAARWLEHAARIQRCRGPIDWWHR
jgi:exonuclease III